MWPPLGGSCDTTGGPLTCLSISLAVSRQHPKVIVVASSPGGRLGFLPVHGALRLPPSGCKAFWELKRNPFLCEASLPRTAGVPVSTIGRMFFYLPRPPTPPRCKLASSLTTINLHRRRRFSSLSRRGEKLRFRAPASSPNRRCWKHLIGAAARPSRNETWKRPEH